MAYKNIKKQNPSKQYNPKSVAKRLNKPKMLTSLDKGTQPFVVCDG